MVTQFKLWAAAYLSDTWSQRLEQYIVSKNPQTHAELEQVISEFENTLGDTQ